MAVRTSHYDRETGKTHVTLEHIGLVVGIGSQYMGDGDSHYWAEVFDPESGEFKQVGLGYTPYDAKVDAEESLQQAYDGLKAAELALARAKVAVNTQREWMLDEVRKDHEVRKGSPVKVVRGRKVPKGTVGVVKVRHEGNYGWSLLLTLADGSEVWTAETNVEPLLTYTVEPQPVALEVAA